MLDFPVSPLEPGSRTSHCPSSIGKANSRREGCQRESDFKAWEQGSTARTPSTHGKLFPVSSRLSSFGILKSTRADSPQGVLIMARGEAAGSQCCGPVGGMGRILRKEVQIPPASGQFVPHPPPPQRWRPSRAHGRSGAAEAKFG